MLDLLGYCTFQGTALDETVVTNSLFNILLHFKWQMIFLLKLLTVKNSCFTSIHNYGSVTLWNLNFGSFCEWRHRFARSWSIWVILSDHCIIVPHLNDKWFFYHKLYHPKLLWLIHIVQWYCEILILVHFASDGTSLPDLEAYESFWVTTVLLFHI